MHKQPKAPCPIERWEGEGGATAEAPFDWRARLILDAWPTPLIRGTSLPAVVVLELIKDGWTWATLIEKSRWPITADDIRACLMWAEEGRPTS